MRTLLLTCLIFTFAGSLRSAEAAAPSARVVSLRVLALKGLVTDLAVRSPQGRTRIVARASAFSSDIDALAEDGFVRFFNRAPAPVTGTATPGTSQEPAAGFAVEEGVERYLVIIAAVGQGAERRFSAYAMPDAGEALPAHHARVVNFTEGPLAVRLGAGAAVVAASRSSVMPCSPGLDGHTDLQLARLAGEGEWRLVSNTRVAVPGGRRLLLLITPARAPARSSGDVVVAAGGVFNVRVVFDTEPPAGPAAPGTNVPDAL